MAPNSVESSDVRVGPPDPATAGPIFCLSGMSPRYKQRINRGM